MKATYYDILGVGRGASFEIIHAAYRALMLRQRKHPDLGGDPEEAKTINEAYSVLKDSDKRSRYDEKIGKVPIWRFWERAKPEPTERRRAVRTSVNATVSFCLNHDHCWNAARVKDYSVIGLRLLSHEPIKKGQAIVISCANTASQAIHGTVRWVRMTCPSIFERVYEAGVEFTSPIHDISQRLSI
jgi:curved DNA-binding protein CbpA